VFSFLKPRRRIPSSQEILREMLEELSDLRRSQRHIVTLRGHLKPFVAAFPRIETVSDADIVAYLRRLSMRIGDRTRDNIRDSIVTLARYARRRNYLPEDRKSAAEKIRRIKPGQGEVATWSPGEAALLLENVSPRWLPIIAIGLFAGLRKSEILRLDWSAFKWDARNADDRPAPFIAVKRTVARKIRIDRLIPIQPNLATWLAPYRDRIGPLYPGHFKTVDNGFSREMSRIRAATGLPRRDNAARHSYGSFRLAVIKSYEQVSIEMGNSPRKVKEFYNNPKSEAEGIAFFNLAPPSQENVIPMELPLRFHA
jgi:integrase